MAMPSISREEMAALFGETSSDDELEQPYEYASQVEAANQELWLVDRQPGSEDDDHRTVDTLAAELGWAVREQAEQQSGYSLELEYMKRDLEVQVQTVDKALRQLCHQKHEMATETGKVQAELQAQQTQAAALRHALHQEQSRCAWQQGCITHLTQQLASLQAEVTQLTAAQASHVERALLQTQNNAKREHLERVNDYQAAELMKLQREIYQLGSLMAAHGLDPALASEVTAVSHWSMATTPEHLWETSSTSMTPPSSSTQGLSPAAPSPDNSQAAAFMPCWSSTSSAQELKVASAGLTATSPAQAGASAGHHYASTGHSLHAGFRSLILSGSPMAGLGRTGPQVRMTNKQQARQDAVAAALSRSTSASAATPSGASSTPASAYHSAGAPVVKRRPDSTAGSAATPSAAAGKPSIRVERGSLPSGTPVLSTDRRPSLRGSKSCMVASSTCHSNRNITSKENSCSDSNKENNPGTGKTRTPATSSLWASQQQPLASRALLQLTPCSPTACKSPSAAMADGDETPSSPGFSPHALQLRAIPVPFWGEPPAVPLAAADSCATAAGTLGTATAAATAPASAAAASVPAALTVTATATAAVLQTPIARTLHFTDDEQAAAPAAIVEPSQAWLAKLHAERQQKPLHSCDIIDTVSMLIKAPASSTATSRQYLIADDHAALSPPRQAMAAGSTDMPMATDFGDTSAPFRSYALQVRVTDVPFRGLPAAAPLVAANKKATAAGIAGSATTAATAPKSAPAPPAKATACVAAAPVTPATATTADQDPVAKALHLTDAEQAAAPAVILEPGQAHGLNAHAEKEHCAQSSIADITSAVIAKENQPRVSRRRTASVAAPAASRIVTRSQAAAEKHVQRMRLRSQRK